AFYNVAGVTTDHYIRYRIIAAGREGYIVVERKSLERGIALMHHHPAATIAALEAL
ncbi:unnamed protein product, partial [marine sediment metagenome]